MVVREVREVQLTDGAVVHQGDVIPSCTTERYYVVGLVEIESGGETHWAVLLRNLTTGAEWLSSGFHFEAERDSGDDYPIPAPLP